MLFSHSDIAEMSQYKNYTEMMKAKLPLDLQDIILDHVFESKKKWYADDVVITISDSVNDNRDYNCEREYSSLRGDCSKVCKCHCCLSDNAMELKNEFNKFAFMKIIANRRKICKIDMKRAKAMRIML